MTDQAFPILTSLDLEASRQFYEHLGFRQTYQFPEQGEAAFVTVERGKSILGISRRTPADPEEISLWVYVDDLDSTLEVLSSYGSEVIASPEVQPWGERIARVRDPEGWQVILGEIVAGEPA